MSNREYLIKTIKFLNDPTMLRKPEGHHQIILVDEWFKIVGHRYIVSIELTIGGEQVEIKDTFNMAYGNTMSIEDLVTLQDSFYRRVIHFIILGYTNNFEDFLEDIKANKNL